MRDDEGGVATKKQSLESWLQKRKEAFPDDPSQARTVTMSVFQDDITVIAIGEEAAADTEEDVPRIVEGRYQVSLSKKEEANMPFAQSFSTIGATYEMQSLDRIVCRPTEKTFGKYSEWVDRLRKFRGSLIPLEDLQKFVGLHHFMTRFLEQGALLCNSGYGCLRAAAGLKTRKKMDPYSKELASDAEKVLSRISNRELPPLTENPRSCTRGRQEQTQMLAGRSLRTKEAGASA